MARMIPSDGPSYTDSKAEKSLYTILKEQLSDEFVVVHSLPWLTPLTRSSGGEPGAKLLGAPTGEIDFLVLHAELGVLAIEVKGGRYALRDNRFIKASGQSVPVIKQVRHNAHGFANQFDPEFQMPRRIGYAVAFPDSSFERKSLPPPLRGIPGSNDDLVIMLDDISCVGERIMKIMAQWVIRSDLELLGKDNLEKLVQLVSPNDDGEPTWSVRIYGKDERWLRLTDEQLDCIEEIEATSKMVVLGWPGTGKTLLATEVVKRAAKAGKSTLFITFNKLIGGRIKKELESVVGCQVYYFHELLKDIEPYTGGDNTPEAAEKILRDGLAQGFFKKWGRLVVDEGQALAESWHRTLGDAFNGKPTHIFCDDAQRFGFEAGSSSSSIADAYQISRVFQLTYCLRSPFQISQLLKDLIPPAFHLICPRPKELDTLTEVASGDLSRDLVAQLDTLLEHEVSPLDIALLYPYSQPIVISEVLGIERFRGMQCANVAAFRGMESRVVVFLVDRQLSNELPIFSAYSRATSRCIAIYSYEVLRDILKRGERASSRHTLGFALRSNKVLQTIANELAKISYFHTFSNIQKLEVSSAHIYWHDHWRGWLIDLRENEPGGFFWADHLCQYSWPVVYKVPDSNQIRVYKGNRRIDENSDAMGDFHFSICDECCSETGHALGTGCLSCASQSLPEVRESFLEELCQLDKRLMRNAAREEEKEGTKLSLSLVALGMARLAIGQGADNIDKLIMGGGTPGYGAASTILRSYVVISARDQINRSKFTDRFFKYIENSPQAMSFLEWKKIVASAFNIAVKHGVIERVGKTDSYIVKSRESFFSDRLFSSSQSGLEQ